MVDLRILEGRNRHVISGGVIIGTNPPLDHIYEPPGVGVRVAVLRTVVFGGGGPGILEIEDIGLRVGSCSSILEAVLQFGFVILGGVGVEGVFLDISDTIKLLLLLLLLLGVVGLRLVVSILKLDHCRLISLMMIPERSGATTQLAGAPPHQLWLLEGLVLVHTCPCPPSILINDVLDHISLGGLGLCTDIFIEVSGLRLLAGQGLVLMVPLWGLGGCSIL